jgi:ankyrin repeat protein
MSGSDKQGRTDLHYAAIDGDVDTLKQLLASGSDPNAQDSQGWTPLHFAAQASSSAAAEALLAAGARTDLRDSHGNTPLFRAVFSYAGDGGVISALRAAGADPHAKNLSDVSPVSLARAIANYDVANFFVDLAEV